MWWRRTQSLTEVPRRTVLTYYWPLCDRPPVEARREALARPLAEWQEMVTGELLDVHPELEGAIERVDVWVWGARHDPADAGVYLGAGA